MRLPRRFRFIWRYLRGDMPWDSGIVPPEITGWIAEYEAQGGVPGRALDVGCGTGTTSLFLAEHGWEVQGLDFAPNAIARARRKARAANLRGSVQFESADVSRHALLADAAPFELVVDIGCLHGLTPDQRRGYAANLKRLTTPGATYLLYAFQPGLSRDGQRAIGIDRTGLDALLGPEFEVVDVVMSVDVTTPRASGWYTLRRVAVQL